MYMASYYDTKTDTHGFFVVGDTEKELQATAESLPSIVVYVSDDVADQCYSIIPYDRLNSVESIINEVEYSTSSLQNGETGELTGYVVPVDKWREIRAALRRLPSVEIKEELYKPTECRVVREGRVIFDGLDKSAYLGRAE